MYQYQGKTALVTGASSGLGKAFAQALAARGMNVILVARSKDRLNALSQELTAKYPSIKATVVAADLNQAADLQELVGQIEQQNLTVDMLVNNAGFGTYGYFDQIEPANDQELIRVNIAALVSLTHTYLPKMLARGNGAIINVASLQAFAPITNQPVYSASKAFVLSLTHSLRHCYSKRGVQVFALCPGATATNFFDYMSVSINMKMPTADEVVAKGLKAFEQGKASYVPGAANKMVVFMPRLLPIGLVTAILDKLFKQVISKA